MTRQEQISAAIKRVNESDVAVLEAQSALDAATVDSQGTQQKMDMAQSAVLDIGQTLLQKGIVQNAAQRAVSMAQGERSNAIQYLKDLEASQQPVMI